MKPITLDGFEQTFQGSTDPWATFTARDEAVKRGAILHALGTGPYGRVLELGAGNGSNSVPVARRALALDATEGTAAGTELTRKALAGNRRARAVQLPLPGRFPRITYDAIVIAELLYYLSPRAMAQVARDVADALSPGGRLVLAHHRIDFHDFAQHAAGIHQRFLTETARDWRCVREVRNGRWIVTGYQVGASR